MKREKFITTIRNMIVPAGMLVYLTLLLACETQSKEIVPVERGTETSSVLDSLDISPEFTWKTTKVVSFSFDAVSYNPGFYSKIAIRNEDGDEILSGGAGNNIMFVDKLSIASGQTSLSVMCTFPSGNRMEKTFTISDAEIAFTFNENAIESKSITMQITDSDGDGVPDDLDDYPNNKNGAYTSFSPDGKSYGTLLFEDNWPVKGDYDFNDLVMRVGVIYVTKGNNKVFFMKLLLRVKAAGAGYDNGFGVWLPEISKDDLSGATVKKIVYEPKAIVECPDGDWSYVLPEVPNPDNLPVEEGQGDKVVVMAIDNIDDVIIQEDPAGDWAFNTKRDGNNGIGKRVELNFWFKDLTSIQVNSLNCESMNFFMTKNQDRTTEIHLRNQAPTDKMNSSLFGTRDDYSVPSEDTYYITSSNLPWAIYVGADITWPLEYINVLQAFPEFEGWATSGGTSNTDWYEHPESSKVW
ncbi:LruC domain-containing protein [Saccharicrinis sp. FJH54]|uniref:LruC domain-containing protein n=1 Tax=Saccharicrinis sp. FJH54 TaxID=3344665 RepID=UPI0035D44736